MKATVYRLIGDGVEIELSKRPNLRELISKVSNALDLPLQMLNINNLAVGDEGLCAVYTDDSPDEDLIEFIKKHAGRELSESDELKVYVVLNLGPGHYRPTAQNPHGRAAYCGLVDNPSSPFFREAMGITVDNDEGSFSERATRISFNDFPEDCLDPVFSTLMDNPVIASDGRTYDAKTLKELKSSPFTREPLGHTTLMNLRLRSKIEDILSKAESGNSLIQQLETYIKRIKSYSNYKQGFWLYKDSRSINREVNYQLAIKLKEKLDEEESIETVFKVDHIKQLRADIVRKGQFNLQPHYKNRGIHSKELNKIIKTAKQKMVASDERNPLLVRS